MAHQQSPHGAGPTARAAHLLPTGPARVIKVAEPAAEPATKRPHQVVLSVRSASKTSSGASATPAAVPIVIRSARPPIEVPPTTVDRDYSGVVPATPYGPEQPRRPVRRLLLAGLVAVALVSAVTLTLIYALSDPEPIAAAGVIATPGTEASAPPRTVATSRSGVGVSSPLVPASEAPVTPLGPAGSNSADAPAGLTAVAAVRSGDVIEVSESVRWPDGGPSDIVLAVPPLDLNGVPADLAPRVRALQVSIDGSAVLTIPGEKADTWTVAWPSGSAPERMEVRYLLDGAIERSTPSQAGRALAVIAPLSQGSVADLPVRVTMAGQGVLGLACALDFGETPTLCGQVDGDRWTAAPEVGAATVVIIQLSLPPIG